MSIGVSHLDQPGFFGGGPFDTFDASDMFHIQHSPNGSGPAQSMVEELLRPDSSEPTMVKEAVKARSPSEPPNQCLVKEAADASTWSQGNGMVSYASTQDHASPSVDTGGDGYVSPKSFQQPESNNAHRSGGQSHTSAHSTPIKRSGTPCATSEQRPQITRTSSHNDKPSKDDKAHSPTPAVASVAPCDANTDNRSRSFMGLSSVVHPRASSPTGSRQQLQPQANRTGSNLRQMWTAGDSEDQSSLYFPAHPFDQVQNQGSFPTVPSPRSIRVHPRGHSGFPHSYHANGYCLADGDRSPYPAKAELHEDHEHPYYAGSTISPPHAYTLPRLPYATHQNTYSGSSNQSMREMNVLPQPILQHFQPFGDNFDMHRNLGQQGFGGLKQEDSSPRSMASVPTVGTAGETGFEINTPPERRTLHDLETNPTFNDDEDRARLARIFNAMMNMPSAQDNEGMKKTWLALSKDRTKVQLVCKKVLVSC